MARDEFARLLPSNLGISQASFDQSVIPTLAEVQHQLHRLRRGKAAGPDRLPPDVLKAGSTSMARHLTVLIAKITTQGREPCSWRTGRLIPLHKGKLHRSNPDGYRSIFLNNFSTKVYHSILRQHLVTSWHSALSHIQFGGRKGLGCDSARHVIQAHLLPMLRYGRYRVQLCSSTSGLRSTVFCAKGCSTNPWMTPDSWSLCIALELPRRQW